MKNCPPRPVDVATFVQIGATGLGIGSALFYATPTAAKGLGYVWINANIRADNDGRADLLSKPRVSHWIIDEGTNWIRVDRGQQQASTYRHVRTASNDSRRFSILTRAAFCQNPLQASGGACSSDAPFQTRCDRIIHTPAGYVPNARGPRSSGFPAAAAGHHQLPEAHW